MVDSVTYNSTTNDSSWTLVGTRKKRPLNESFHNSPEPKVCPNNSPSHGLGFRRGYDRNDKISEPCWFYNNGGCRHKDGSEKTAEECKYLHIYSENVKRPPHLSIKKPCDKYNLEGECRWHDNCKYSHRNLNPDDWSRYYPGIPYTLKTNIQKRIQLENKVCDIEGRMKVVEFKQDGMSKDIQIIGQGVQQCLRQLQILVNRH